MKTRIFLCSLLLALSASAQTLLPARQVSVSTNLPAWANLSPSAATLQLTLDWIDANWMRIDASAWTAIPTNLTAAQEVFTWLDGNLRPPLSTTSWLFLSPTSDTEQATFDFIDFALLRFGSSISNLSQVVQANADSISIINSNLNGFVRSSELCDLVTRCSGSAPAAPAAGETSYFYGNLAYSAQEFVVPTNASSITFHASGAGGNAPASAMYGAFGGAGAYVSGTMAVDTNAAAVIGTNSIPTGAVVRIYAGLSNFGQNSEEGGGGRATRVFVVHGGATNLLFIAAGGGGASPYCSGTAGAGGYPTGYAGASRSYTSADWGGPLFGGGGGGGTQSAGGAGGVGSIASLTHPLCVNAFAFSGVAGAIWSSASATRGNPGGPWSWSSLRVPGTTCAQDYETSIHYGGGQGGDGYYGGGGGGSAVATSTGYRNGVVVGGCGGGGSSWVSAYFAGATNESTGTSAAYADWEGYKEGYGGARQPGILAVKVELLVEG